MPTSKVIHGDSREELLKMPDNSIDAVVTDPPYELGFMEKKWDSTGVAYDFLFWLQVLRVLKPGGHMVAFSSTRTYHRVVVAIEDAGFEIRDQLIWMFGSGFPKSLDVAKAIDKKRFERSSILKVTKWIKKARDAAGLTNAQINDAFGFAGQASHWTTQGQQPSVPTLEQIPHLLKILGDPKVPVEIKKLMFDLNGSKYQAGEGWLAREIIGVHKNQYGMSTFEENLGRSRQEPGIRKSEEPTREEAKRWQGYGTALKPAYEPIVLARKPLEGTIADNVRKWGTGGINIDGCRIGSSKKVSGGSGHDLNIGRWPANLVLDEEASCMIDDQSVNTGGASRFFYVAKPGTAERELGLDLIGQLDDSVTDRKEGSSGQNNGRAGIAGASRVNMHPTVKPVALMRWLIRLVTPPGDPTILDPFLGSGTTGMAAAAEGVSFVGIEAEEESAETARKRIAIMRS